VRLSRRKKRRLMNASRAAFSFTIAPRRSRAGRSHLAIPFARAFGEGECTRALVSSRLNLSTSLVRLGSLKHCVSRHTHGSGTVLIPRIGARSRLHESRGRNAARLFQISARKRAAAPSPSFFPSFAPRSPRTPRVTPLSRSFLGRLGPRSTRAAGGQRNARERSRAHAETLSDSVFPSLFANAPRTPA